MRIVIAGGGTGGHTSAGLAVAAALVQRGVEVHWIGSRRGLEARRAPEAGLAFHAISTGKLRRYWDWQNVPDLSLRVPAGFAQSWRLLRRLKPRLLFATGGFVALPPALAARMLRIPVVVHEQTAVPGLANRVAARFARRVALTFPLTGGEIPAERAVLTGNPLRPELAGGSREAGCRLRGSSRPSPSSTSPRIAGGSTSSTAPGGRASAFARAPQLVISVAIPDQGDRAWLEAARPLPAALVRRYALRPYIGAELRDIFAAAELVVGRSGAGTVNECCQLGRAALYVPLPGTSGDEQTANARLVEAAGGAVLLPQISLTPERLLEAVTRLLADRAELARMGERARALAVPDAADRIARLVLEAAGA